MSFDDIKYVANGMFALEIGSLAISAICSKVLKTNMQKTLYIGAYLPIAFQAAHIASHKIVSNKKTKSQLFVWTGLTVASVFSMQKFLEIKNYNWAFKKTPNYVFWGHNIACVATGVLLSKSFKFD